MKNNNSEKNIKINVDNGIWIFKLGTVLEKKRISKNKIMRDTNTKHDTLQGYIKGTLKRIDLDVLDRFCKYLDCELNEIIEYVRKK